MDKGKRVHEPEFKATLALKAVTGKFTVAELAEQHQVHPSLLHSWKNRLVRNAHLAMSKSAQAQDGAAEALREKEREIARLTAENEWLQRVAQRLNPAERRAAVETENPSIPLLRQVKLLNVNRSGIYYRLRHAHPPVASGPAPTGAGPLQIPQEMAADAHHHGPAASTLICG